MATRSKADDNAGRGTPPRAVAEKRGHRKADVTAIVSKVLSDLLAASAAVHARFDERAAVIDRRLVGLGQRFDRLRSA